MTLNENPSRPAEAAEGGPLRAGRLKTWLRLLAGRLGLGLLGLAAAGGLIYLVATADGFMKSGELEREKVKLEAEIEALKDENRILRQKLDRVQTDPGYVEDEARKKLGLVKPGETVYRLSEEPDLQEP